MEKPIVKHALLAFGLGTGLSVGAAHAALLDFTDSTVWSDPSDTKTVDFGPYSTTASVSAESGSPAFRPYDGPTPVQEPFASSGLFAANNPDTGNDGIGVAPGDEIADPGEDRIVVDFSAPVVVEAFHFLDLFEEATPGATDQEVAEVYLDGELAFSFEFGAEEDFAAAASGYFFTDDFAPRAVSRVGFEATPGNDLVAEPDYALAGIEVAPVPVPAAGLLLFGGLGGLGLFARRRRH